MFTGSNPRTLELANPRAPRTHEPRECRLSVTAGRGARALTTLTAQRAQRRDGDEPLRVAYGLRFLPLSPLLILGEQPGGCDRVMR